MKLLKFIALAMALALSVVILSACGNKLEGKWETDIEGYTMIFEFDDGEVECYMEYDGESQKIFDGEYEVDGDTLKMDVEYAFEEGVEKIEMEYEIDGDELSLTNVDGETKVFTKVK